LAGALVLCAADASHAQDALFKDGFECAALPLTHAGCEFYAVPLANTALSPAFAFAVQLANPGTDPAAVVITGGALVSPVAVTVAPAGSFVVQLPWVEGLQTKSTSVHVVGGAYRIVSDRPLVAHQFNPFETDQAGTSSYTNEASLLLPVHAFSGNYRVAAWPSWETFPGYFAVVGTENGTAVTVSPAATVLAGGGLSGTGGSITLDRGDVLQVLAPPPGPLNLSYLNDLSGSLVTASRPVAVFGGHDLTFIPASAGYGDHLEEQLPPLETLGTAFLVAVPANPFGTTRHFVKVVGTEDGTTLTYAPSTPAGAGLSLDAGQVTTFEATADFQITATDPLIVSQYFEGETAAGAGDPAMGIVVPFAQFQTQEVVVAPQSYITNRITIVAPAGTPVTLDGAPIAPASFTAVSGSAYAVARLAVSPGEHRVAAAVPIGVYAYGYAQYTSYLFPAGMGLAGVSPTSATLFPWSAAATDDGDLSVSGVAGLNGTATGLRALVDDTAGLYVQDDTPAGEGRYRARFYFDPNGFDPGEAQAHRRTRIFIVFEEGPTRRLAAVVLRRLNGAFALMARARLDDNAQADTPFFPISDGPHSVEIDWRRSSGPEALDGSLELWIDGVPVATLSGLDNSRSAVDFARVGALSVKSGSGGEMYWDEFESRRDTYIGP
jgi:hypothetical protein